MKSFGNGVLILLLSEIQIGSILMIACDRRRVILPYFMRYVYFSLKFSLEVLFYVETCIIA